MVKRIKWMGGIGKYKKGRDSFSLFAERRNQSVTIFCVMYMWLQQKSRFLEPTTP